MLSLVSGHASQAMNLASFIPAGEIVVRLLDSTPPLIKGKTIPPFKESIKLEKISFSHLKNCIKITCLKLSPVLYVITGSMLLSKNLEQVAGIYAKPVLFCIATLFRKKCLQI
jgi:hypothetical protein